MSITAWWIVHAVMLAGIIIGAWATVEAHT